MGAAAGEGEAWLLVPLVPFAAGVMCRLCLAVLETWFHGLAARPRRPWRYTGCLCTVGWTCAGCHRPLASVAGAGGLVVAGLPASLLAGVAMAGALRTFSRASWFVLPSALVDGPRVQCSFPARARTPPSPCLAPVVGSPAWTYRWN